ncbi:glycosyltransferase family 4 protein [Pseudanabaena mucicola]|uniref:Glycosyltransferase family 1 protein n=1 Tax=Pseudanabaena mucicola FACHB-723 TaxID=2692860 RepID=A0ABR7ZY45_9CYAN|nr:glycosyltransferase family 1 protein [Pseudanabaena mucicola]MBD2188901.1 glycosyltransferase family 1 protein [Pseudanabaena mucicola FACHB-723]
MTSKLFRLPSWDTEVLERSLYTPIDSQHRYALISVHGDPSAQLGKDGAGGQNLYVKSLGFALAKRGCQVDMFTRREDPQQPQIIQHANGCRTIRLTAGPTKFIHRDELFPYLPEFVEAWLDFQKQSGLNYDIIHSNYWLSGWVGMQLRSQLSIPQVHTYHSVGAVKYRAMNAVPEIALSRLGVEWACLEQTDCVIATSQQEQHDLRELVSQHGEIKIIPCSVDIEHFSGVDKASARKQLGIAAEQKVILYVGRFDERKGIETLVRACAQLPKPLKDQYQLYLVGGSRKGGVDTEEEQRIRGLVKDLGLDAIASFVGAIDQSELPPYYAMADICVVPSYYEPFGLVAIEAMAAGTPVIASRVGGLQETVKDGETGLLVPIRAPEALSTAIAKLLTEPQTVKAMGRAGYQRVHSHYSQDAVAGKIHHLYESLIAKNMRKKTQSAIAA